MTAQPDIIWNEQCLGIRIGEQVCTYLKKHDAEYQRLQNKILELTERYPVIETFMESNQAISLTTEEHKAVHQYFRLESEKEMIEEQYHFYMGQAQMISYGAMLGKIKKQYWEMMTVTQRNCWSCCWIPGLMRLKIS
ncbi:MAG: DUF6664 family protein [Blautia obeum]